MNIELPLQECPNCKHPVNAALQASPEGPARPAKAGDFLVCIYCAALNRVGDGSIVRAATAAEEAAILRSPKAAKYLISVAVIREQIAARAAGGGG